MAICHTCGHTAHENAPCGACWQRFTREGRVEGGRCYCDHTPQAILDMINRAREEFGVLLVNQGKISPTISRT